MSTVRYHSCNICEAMCGTAVTVEDGRIVNIRADPDDVFSRGHICPKGPAMKEVYEDPDRLRRPVRRTAAGWEPISWQEALDETADQLSKIRAAHGPHAVALYAGNPGLHTYGTTLMMEGFRGTLGSRNYFDSNSADANPKLFSSMLMFGDQLSVPVPDVERTDYLLILGANPAASNGSLMSLGDVRKRLRGIRERGGHIVLIDPRRTETAAWCDEHHYIRPGGDAAFLLAVLSVLFAEGHVGAAVEQQVNGLETVRALAKRFPPERVAGAVGIAADTIRDIARGFASAPRAVAYGRLGICQNPFGPVANWLVDVLNIVTGNFDRPGGAMFTTPAVDLARIGRALIGNHYDRWRSRVRDLPEFAGQLPSATLREEIVTPGSEQIRALVTVAGNPVLSVPNGQGLAEALPGLSFMVSIDYYINETTRHAHIILPPVHSLERDHFDLVFHNLAVHNTVKYAEPVVPPAPDTMSDWEILYELGMRLGGLRFGVPGLDGLARQLWRRGIRFTPTRMLDLLLRVGPYGDRFLPFHPGLNLRKLRRAPHGIDLGPLQPTGKQRIRTPDGRVNLAPALLVADAERLDSWLAQQGHGLDSGNEKTAQRNGKLLLIGRRHLRSNNSWMHNAPSLAAGHDRATLLMHPEDAHRLELADGAQVEVRSRVGVISVRLEHSDDIMPGVVSLPHGFGHAAAADTLRVAGALPGANVNAITDEEMIEPLVGTAVLNGVPVTVTAASAAR